MQGSFEAKVVPLTLYVLSVMERIRSSAGASPEQDEVRPRLKNYLGQFNVRGPQEEDFALAKTAMVYWIDELLVNSEWEFASQWRDNPLEREIYGSRNRAWKFFENADYARSLEQTDALETFAQCVALGFQGIYRSESLRAAAVTSKRLPEVVQDETTPELSADTVDAEASGHQINGHAQTNGTASSTALLTPAQKTTAPEISVGHQPQTLAEWAAPVFSQLRGEQQPPFQPITPSETPRDAQPLLGKQHFIRWGIALAVTTAISLCILAVRGF